MIQNIYTFSLSLSMKLMNSISIVDRFDASWRQIEKREGQSLKQLKSIATVRSVGASTRIEGSKMGDAEVEVLIEKLKVSKLEERDEQEVAGYFEALDTITEAYNDIDISEGNIKNLHNLLMKHCTTDAWHRGKYKQVSNAVEASYADGSKQIVFTTTEPGFETDDAMRKLIKWYHADKETLPIIRNALFVYEFLSIHPFQDGNGRLSRLLATLLLLKSGYSWIQYVSFEHEIEARKAEYYKVLMQTQKQRPGEKVDDWIFFFLDCLMNIQDQLMDKLKTNHQMAHLNVKEKNILTYIQNHPGSRSGEIAKKLNLQLPTVKKIVGRLHESKLIGKNGVGPGTNYVAEEISALQKDLLFKLTNTERQKTISLKNAGHTFEIKKIIVVPLFDWTRPEEWNVKLLNEGLCFKIKGVTARGNEFENMYSLVSFCNPYLYQPVFNLTHTIQLPLGALKDTPKFSEYPIQFSVELVASVPEFHFDVLFVYDELA